MFLATASTAANDASMFLNGLVTSGGSFTAVTAGMGASMTVGGCFCGNPVTTTSGGTEIFDVDGIGGTLTIAEALTITGPTVLVADASISGGPIDPPTLDIYGTDGVTASIPVTLHSYGEFGGVPFPTGASLPGALLSLIQSVEAAGGQNSGAVGSGTGGTTQSTATQSVLTSTNGSSTNNNGSTTQISSNVSSTNLSQTLPPPPPLPPIVVLAPPPPPEPLTLTTSVPTGSGGQTVAVVTDIDTGGQIFTQIAPTSGGTGSSGQESQDPTTVVAPVTTAPQHEAKSQPTETPVGGPGSSIFQTHTVFVQHLGIPGIAQAMSMEGNRSLWFGTLGGP